MTAEGPRRVLVRCDGAPVPPSLGEQHWDLRRFIRSRGDRANLTLRIEELAGSVLTRVGPRAADLVRIAAYAYRADSMVPRTGAQDDSDERWKRHFALCVLVATPAYWRDPEVTERLAAALRFGTDDGWEFAFSEASPDAWQVPLEPDPAAVYAAPTCVVLFSGGADSLSVLLDAVLKGQRPVAVGHWSTAPHEWRQRDLLKEVRRRHAGWAIPHIGFEIHGARQEGPENTQRTRGFLYACLGAVTAAETGVDRVLFGDNGPVSINLPVSDQVVGARASRSTHPQFLERFNRLIAGMFDHPIVVENPLLTSTRPEALEVLGRAQCQDLLTTTLSCSNWRGLPLAIPHCGGCSQCVGRRFATVVAGLEAYDPASRYQTDVFLDDLLDADARMMAVSYVRFARRVNQLSDLEFVTRYGELLEAVSNSDRHAGATAERLVALIKRHAQGVLRALKIMTERHLNDLVEGTLPEGCLLRIVFAGTAVPDAERGEPMHGGPLGDPDDEETPTPIPAEAACVFDGDRWQFTYGGLPRAVKDTVNVRRLVCLLAEPFREFRPEELLTAAHPTSGPKMDEGEARQEGLWVEHYGAGGFVFDEDSDAFIELGISELLAEIEDARDDGNAERIAELEAEIKRTKESFEKGLKLGRTPRPISDHVTRRPDSFRRSLERGIHHDIADRHPDLARHLDLAVTKETARFAYKPREEIRWIVSRPPV